MHRNIGSIPALGDLTPEDQAALETSNAAFGNVGGLIAKHRQRQAISEAMRVVGEANKYLADQAPWKLKESQPERMRDVLAVACQLVADANTLLSPFMPHSARLVAETFGAEAPGSPLPELREVSDLDRADREYPIITGDYTGARGTWGRTPCVAGTPVPRPAPIFDKLDDGIVEEEIARMAQE